MTWYIFRHCETLNNILKAKYKKENPNLYYNRSDYDTLLTIKGVNQAQSIHFTAQIYQNGEPTDEEITILESGANKDSYSLIKNGNEITILAYKIDSIPLTLVFQGNGVADKTINLKLKSMF